MHCGIPVCAGGGSLGNSTQSEQGQSESRSAASPNLLMRNALSGFNVDHYNEMLSSDALQLQDPLSGSSFAHPFAQQVMPAASLAVLQNTANSVMTHFQHDQLPCTLPSMALNQPSLVASQAVAMGSGHLFSQGGNTILSKVDTQTNNTEASSSHRDQQYSLCQGAPQQNLQQQQCAEWHQQQCAEWHQQQCVEWHQQQCVGWQQQPKESLTQKPHIVDDSNHLAGYAPQAQNPHAPKTSHAPYTNAAGGSHLHCFHHQQTALGQSATATTAYSQTMTNSAISCDPQAQTSSGMTPNGCQRLPASVNLAGVSMGQYGVPSSYFAFGGAMTSSPAMAWSTSVDSWNVATPQPGLLAADESFLTPEWIQSLSNPNLLNLKKRKRRKKPKDQPKRALSAYNIFFKDERELIMRDGVGDEELAQVRNIAKDEKKDPHESVTKKSLSKEAEQNMDEKPTKTPALTQKRDKGEKKQRIGFENLGKVIGKRWKELSVPRRGHYQVLADADLIRYKEAMEDWHIKHEGKDFEKYDGHC